MPTILMNLPPHAVGDAGLAQMRAIVPDYTVRVTQDRDEIAALLDDVEILAGWPAGDVLTEAPNLRWYQQWSAGSDWLVRYPQAAERPFQATTASGVHPAQITEHTFALMLAFVRKLPQVIRQQAAGEWTAPAGESLRELYEQTLLMVGLGAIGERIALVGNALGMRVSRRATNRGDAAARGGRGLSPRSAPRGRCRRPISSSSRRRSPANVSHDRRTRAPGDAEDGLPR